VPVSYFERNSKHGPDISTRSKDRLTMKVATVATKFFYGESWPWIVYAPGINRIKSVNDHCIDFTEDTPQFGINRVVYKDHFVPAWFFFQKGVWSLHFLKNVNPCFCDSKVLMDYDINTKISAHYINLFYVDITVHCTTFN